MELVSWEDCKQFCEKSGFLLPTEAQWEYACRAGTSGPFAGTGKLDDMGWSKENSGKAPHPVGEKQPNDFGLHDVHGNVYEWCEDMYDRHFYSTPDASKKDPVCRSGTKGRVMRGGSWLKDAVYLRSARRRWIDFPYSGIFTGFRPAWSSP